ncbi:SPOR domain-containing protein [Haematospirillum jordaniae]|uniref:SPOR domain-containing protein n=1 Tax=Haematospirillum jordaniae TaxID=1549855 RepID=A0A143DF51_9PROT|nr:SPOR domain-containing protein [Haematospirillum jordaniae]AMW35209.1 hypothetical protein AY555_08525 [Haematospirillum jordaniae]NKD45638.1 SPOR domain-containing protein [Haematospirillum jordaniae]NKD56391.1 SPOR domain-containing protein [Haematospirillum jordaniae]NKD58449.1 SPOR domain-containing protein [Haematospirillum jordaniae]NKD66382.1 SPOR domain-containing protein [Haematospirillum jordaniae]
MADPRGYGPRGGDRNVGPHRAAGEGSHHSGDDIALDEMFARTFERDSTPSSGHGPSAEGFDLAPPVDAARVAAAAKLAAGRVAGQRGEPHDYFSVVPDRIAGTGVTKDADDSRRGRGLLLAAFLIGIAIVGSAGVYMARSNTSGTDGRITAPTILAETNPYKVRPADPGGLQVPNQDKLVYDRLSSGTVRSSGVEKLLPEPVEPVSPSQVERMPSILGGANNSQPVPAVTPDISPPSAIKSNATNTKQLIPLPDVPAGKIVADVPVPVPPVQQAPVVATPPATVNAPVMGERAPVEKNLVAPSNERTLTDKSAPVRPGVTGGSYAVQLAALRDEASVRKTWENLKAKHPQQLASLSMSIERADLGQKGIYYRLRATGLSSEADARRLCAELSKHKVGCLFVGK